MVNNLPKFADEVQKKAGRAMTQAVILGASEAAVMTPVDTSTLLNSQTRRVEYPANKVVGTVRYSADYAKFVHDPAVKQNFRRATAQKEFLSKGFANAKPKIDGIFAEALKT